MIKNNIVEEKKLMLKICVANEGSVEHGLSYAECIYDMLNLQASQLLLNTFQKWTAKGKQRKAHRNFQQILDARLEHFINQKKR